MPTIAIELTDLPQMNPGAPSPIVMANDDTVLLSFFLREGGAAFVCFDGARDHRFGSPGDETLHGHPLHAAGVSQYAVFEIQGSPRIEELKRIDSVHPLHNPERFAEYRHFFFSFHDSCFECVAHSYQYTVRPFEKNHERRAYMLRALENENIFAAETSAVGMR